MWQEARSYAKVGCSMLSADSSPPLFYKLFVFLGEVEKTVVYTYCMQMKQIDGIYNILQLSPVLSLFSFFPTDFLFYLEKGGRRIGRIRPGCRIDVMRIQSRQARKLELVGMRSARRKHPPSPSFSFHILYSLKLKGQMWGRQLGQQIEICENACFVQCIKCIPPPPFCFSVHMYSRFFKEVQG